MPTEPPSSGYTVESRGGTVRPIYSERTMKCYSITESELKQIGLANMAIMISVAIGSALIAFGTDIFKDALLAEQLPDNARVLTEYVQPLCLVFGAIFWVAAAMFWWWRRDMVALIKRESEQS